MAWTVYSDKMKNDGNSMFAGIYDIEAGSPWATSGEGCGTVATPAEIVSLVSVIREKTHLEDGVKFGSQDFMVVNVFDYENSCVMKRKNLPADATENDKLNVVVALTKKACLVGVADGTGKAGHLKKAVCEIQTHLINSDT